MNISTHRPRLGAAALALAMYSGAAQAALLDRGGGMVYDSTLDITWLADWNFAASSGYAAASAGGVGADRILANGKMGWAAAQHWADTLVYGGFDDWRLPSSLNPDGSGPCGPAYGCNDSEMGRMFYDHWSVQAGDDYSEGANLANLGLFSNVQSFFYWSGTAYAPQPDQAWYFSVFDGAQDYASQDSATYAVAVRPGDVLNAVPEPQTLAMVLVALGATAVVRRKRPKRRTTQTCRILSSWFQL